MATVGVRSGGWLNAWLGFAFVAIAVVALFTAPAEVKWQWAGAAFFLGLFLMIAMGPFTEVSEDAALTLPFYRSMGNVARDLKLEGRAIHVAPGIQPRLSVDRVFIPTDAREPHVLPQLDADTSLYTEEPSGISLDPPGRPLLDEHEQRQGVRLTNTAFSELGTVMGSLVAGNRLVKSVNYRKIGTKVTVRYRHAKLEDLCRYVREDLRGPGSQVGCPVCSAMVLAVSRCLHRPVRLDDVREIDGDIFLEMEVLA